MEIILLPQYHISSLSALLHNTFYFFIDSCTIFVAAGDAARLTAEGNAPNLMGSGEISSSSKTRERDLPDQRSWLVAWPSGITSVFGRQTSLSCARPVADG